MKAKGLGIFSVLTASVCCLGPLLLISLGLGGLGMGVAIGKYHWYFIAAAVVMLIFSWRSYLKDKKSCETKQCAMKAKNMTRNILIAATLGVMSFVGFNIYTYANGAALEGAMNAGHQMTIPVKGMTCATCELAVKAAVKKLPGIYDIKASARQEAARVSYDPEKTSLEEIIAAINETGYQAENPKL